jgi:hypothetical protein
MLGRSRWEKTSPVILAAFWSLRLAGTVLVSHAKKSGPRCAICAWCASSSLGPERNFIILFTAFRA